VTTDAPGIAQTWRAATMPAKAVIVGLFVHKLGAFLQVFLVLYLVHRGLSSTYAGLALGMYGAGSIVGVLFGGWLSDRIGPRRAMAMSMAASAVLIISLLYVSGLLAILTVSFTVGVTSQVYRPAAQSMLAAVTPERSLVMVFAMYRLALNLGTTAAPLIGVALIAVSFDLLFWVEAAAMLGYAGIVLVALPSRLPEADRQRSEPEAPTNGGRSVLADRRFVLFLAATFLNSLIYVQYLSTLPLAVTEGGLGTRLYGILIALNGALVIAFELLVTRRTQRWPARKAAATGLALTGIGLAMYAPPLGAAVFVLATVVWTFGEIISAPTMSAYPARAGGPAMRGRYLGAAQAAFGLGFAIGPVVGVVLWNQLGALMWLACGAVGALATAAVWRSIREEDRETTDAARGTG
jgi:predicted MFS family arabinose efflux permease